MSHGSPLNDGSGEATLEHKGPSTVSHLFCVNFNGISKKFSMFLKFHDTLATTILHFIQLQ